MHPQELGPNRDYNIDLVPKFMMANGKLVRVLLHTDVVKYLEFKAVDGSYVLNKGKIHKVIRSRRSGNTTLVRCSFRLSIRERNASLRCLRLTSRPSSRR